MDKKMVCPFRVETHYFEKGGIDNYTFTAKADDAHWIEQHYPTCYKEECPFFEDNKCKRCARQDADK